MRHSVMSHKNTDSTLGRGYVSSINTDVGSHRFEAISGEGIGQTNSRRASPATGAGRGEERRINRVPARAEQVERDTIARCLMANGRFIMCRMIRFRSVRTRSWGIWFTAD